MFFSYMGFVVGWKNRDIGDNRNKLLTLLRKKEKNCPGSVTDFLRPVTEQSAKGDPELFNKSR
jgi:hypothetical protein